MSNTSPIIVLVHLEESHYGFSLTHDLHAPSAMRERTFIVYAGEYARLHSPFKNGSTWNIVRHLKWL